MTEQAVARVLDALMRRYPEMRLDDSERASWVNVLAVADEHRIASAAAKWMTTRRGFPAPAELQGMAKRMSEEGPRLRAVMRDAYEAEVRRLGREPTNTVGGEP